MTLYGNLDVWDSEDQTRHLQIRNKKIEYIAKKLFEFAHKKGQPKKFQKMIRYLKAADDWISDFDKDVKKLYRKK